MNRSNKFFLLNLLLCGLTLQASEEAARIARMESARKQAATIADFQRTIKRHDAMQAGLKMMTDPLLMSGQMMTDCALMPVQMMTDCALMPGQMIMDNKFQGWSTTSNQQAREDFKDAQYGRCMACSATTGAMLCTAGALCAFGLPQAELCASAACLAGTLGYASTLMPYTDDKDRYSCKRSKEKTK